MKDLDTTIILSTSDCSPFQLEAGHEKALQYAISLSSRLNVFRCSSAYQAQEDEPLAWFNSKDGRWWAGRFIGEMTFIYELRTYRVVITPRYGQLFILRMFELIFNVKLLNAQNTLTKSTLNYESLLRKVIALIWLQKLADANRHGLPTLNYKESYIGKAVRGRLDVTKTLHSYFLYDHITSEVREKRYDPLPVALLWQAYRVLQRQYGIQQLSHPDSAIDAIQQLKRIRPSMDRVYAHQYHKIQYKVLYETFKPIVDLSWHIITNSFFENTHQNNEKGFGLFLDVAELWESYLIALFKKAYTPLGWTVEKPEVVVYPSKLFQRRMIPDIVLTKEDWRCIWDAKYKRMSFNPYDIDRADFFQIHTYATYYSAEYSVISCGLIYPADSDPIYEDKLIDYSLYGLGADDTIFSISSMNVNNFQTEAAIMSTEAQFISRFLTCYMKAEL